MKNSILFSLVLGTLSFQSAHGALNLDVTGALGSGQTTWTLSGSYDGVATLPIDGIYSFNDGQGSSSDLNLFVHDPGELSGEILSDAGEGSLGILSGDATVTGNSTGVHNIDGILIFSGDGGGADNFGWFADGGFSTTSETLTFSGSIVIAADIGIFGEGATLIQNLGDSFTVSSTSEITPLNMTFTAVPEPAEVGMGLGLIALFAAGTGRRRNWRKNL